MRECSLILARALAFWSAVGSGAPHRFRRHGWRAEAWRLWKAVSQQPHSKTLPRLRGWRWRGGCPSPQPSPRKGVWGDDEPLRRGEGAGGGADALLRA